MHFEDVAPGYRPPPLRRCPSEVQLFQFSAVTWNAHRIHYDQEHARSEGYPGVLVQSHLHGCFLAQAALGWTAGRGALRRFRWENRRYAVAGELLECRGVVTRVYEQDGRGLVDMELEERNQDGLLCAPGWATIELRRRGGGR